MDTTAQQATTSSSSHRENADSEGARRSFRPGHRMTLQNSVAISDRCDRTEGEKSESENTVSPVNGRKSAAATAARHIHLFQPPGGKVPLLCARPAVTFPAEERHRPSAGTKLYCLVTEAHTCVQLRKAAT